MAATFDEAVAELFRGPHATFVAERKRLAAELKAAGDKPGAATLGKLGRPPLSAWAVNQLWWQARADFDALLETAKKMRGGDLGATSSHREALNTLRARAAKMLTDAGNAANEATLRRVATTLSAIAAHGGFGPEAAGALTDDRDPPGFDALGAVPAPVVALPSAPAAPREERAAPVDESAERAAADEVERQRILAAEARQRRDVELNKARAEVDRLAAELGRLQRQAMELEGALVHARARVAELETSR
jgi:hypothetical protein